MPVNRQMGAQLFLSPRTVGFHLYKHAPGKIVLTVRSESAWTRESGHARAR